METFDCLIVGSGICGLAAANVINNNGINLLVVDKGRGIGGRIASRRVDFNNKTAVFDYGAQYFTVRESSLINKIDDLIDNEIIKVWSNGFDDNKITKKEKHFIGINNMRQFTKHISQNLNINQSTKVNRIKWYENHWSVYYENDENIKSKTLLLTCPIPQSLKLLEDSKIDIDKNLKSNLEEIKYDPCIAILGICDQISSIPEPGGMIIEEGPISWIADNLKKGISPEVPTVTIHLSSEYSTRFWDMENSMIFDEVNKIISESMDIGCSIVDYQIHKWLYSKPVNFYKDPFAHILNPGPIYFAGDAFHSGRVEGAYISGETVGNYISKNLGF